MDLFSVVVLCYRNFEYVYEAIQSVLQQEYPCVEIIVSDDGSTNFPDQSIESYIQEHKGKNIVSVKIRSEKENQGTVRHLNHNIQEANGKYICFLAADDVFYDSQVLSKYAEGFKKDTKGSLIEMAHTAMYDHELQNLEEYYLRPNIQKILEAGPDYPQLYQALCYSPCLPSTSTCFQKDFFRKYGNFDENYWLVEDVPLHLKIAREKIPLHFENFVAIRHRNGGISHGANKALSKTKYKYFRDIKRYHSTVVEELDQYAPGIKKSILRKYKREGIWLDYQMYGKSSSFGKKAILIAKHPWYCIYTILMMYERILGKASAGIVLGGLIGLVSIPGIATALQLLFSIPLELVIRMGYGICTAILVLGVLSFLMHLLASNIKKIEEFPIDLIWFLA